MVLAKVGIGRPFVVARVRLEKEVGRRLADMGFVEGTRGVIIRREVFGGPIQVQLLGYELLLRQSEAEGIEVSVVEQGEGVS